MAIERERYQLNQKAALERHQFLLKEINHRVKNSLTMVGSMLDLQASDAEPDVVAQLKEASSRVTAIARAHDLLSQNIDIEWLDLGKYIKDICGNLHASIPNCEIHCGADLGIEIATDRAISSALAVNELVTNACKYAYDDEVGPVWVMVSRVGECGFSISVRDKGKGLPAEFDLEKTKGLGMRLVRAFARQVGGTLTAQPKTPGTEFRLTVPHSPRPATAG